MPTIRCRYCGHKITEYYKGSCPYCPKGQDAQQGPTGIGQPSCARCKHWSPTMSRRGICTRFPPSVPKDLRGFGVWPETQSSASCGEHTPRPAPCTDEEESDGSSFPPTSAQGFAETIEKQTLDRVFSVLASYFEGVKRLKRPAAHRAVAIRMLENAIVALQKATGYKDYISGIDEDDE